jgi:CBS domain-containing protein
MHISGFMVPASKVAVASPNDTLKAGMDQMLEKKIGAIVVLNESDPEKLDEPVGILTKTDFLTAYNNGLTLETKLKEVMSTELKTVDENMSKDNASKFFEKSKLHHALVVNKDGKFVGIISSWDIAAENARDNRAWPWFRTEDGK